MFTINYIQLFKSVPPQIATMLIAMLPIAELRVSIPVALGGFKMSVASSYVWSIIGNIIPCIVILKYIDPIARWMSAQSKTMRKFFEWLFAKTRYKFKGKYLKYGEFALVLFVAIPLPITGCWTGSLAAFLFGIPPRRAFWLIFAGVAIAGIIVTILSKFGMYGMGIM